MNVVYLYVLKLRQDKYYVGITHNLIIRWRQHCSGEGSRWTRRYPPIEMIFWEEYSNWEDARAAEDGATLILARKGYDVRGGKWTNTRKHPLDQTTNQVQVGGLFVDIIVQHK